MSFYFVNFSENNWFLETLEELIKKTEETLEGNLQDFEDFINEQTRFYSKEQREGYIESILDDYWKYKDEHSQIVRKSFFLQAYFTYEHLLNEVCSHFKRELELKLEIKILMV